MVSEDVLIDRRKSRHVWRFQVSVEVPEAKVGQCYRKYGAFRNVPFSL